MTAFLDDVKKNERVFRVLFDESVNSGFFHRLADLLCSQHMGGVKSSDTLSAHYLRLYIANGIAGMLREWIASGFPLSSRKIAEMMHSLSGKTVG